MTDRHAAYMVVLGNDIREDDAESIVNALRMIKGVINVVPFSSSSSVASETMIAETRIKSELLDKMYKVLV